MLLRLIVALETITHDFLEVLPLVLDLFLQVLVSFIYVRRDSRLVSLAMGIKHDAVAIVGILDQWFIATSFVHVVAVPHLLVLQRICLQHVQLFVFAHLNGDNLLLHLLLIY